MANSLLAHLYTHIRGSQEDIATLSLQYLLMQSSALNKTFTKKISDVLNIKLEENLQYLTQATGENDERPDMSGTDSVGREVVLCEMKFYASLTDNQPVGYLKRLMDNNGKGLLFICPKSRKDTLWYELKKLCLEAELEVNEISDYSVEADGINMAIISWTDIIESLMNTAEASAEHLIADIKQLKGYCEQIDTEAFIPFQAEELSAINAKKAERLYLIIDKVSDMILTDKNIRFVKNSSKAGYRHGYVSYIFVNDFGIAFCYDRNMWKKESSAETPFWLVIKKVNGKEWVQTEDIIRCLNQYPDADKEEQKYGIYLALKVPTHATEDEVCKSIKNQILKYINDVECSLLKNSDKLMEDK